MTSVYPLVKLMAQADPAATVLFDFNADDGGNPRQRCAVEGDDFTIGSPSLQGEYDSIFPQYGPREVGFTARFTGSKAYALGKISAASQWLLRDRSWLMVQLNALMKPVWFKLYRPTPGDLSFGHVSQTDARDVWQWKVTLPAEPFAYGQRITLSTISVVNNPVTGTNKAFYQLPTIQGDAPTALQVKVLPTANWIGSDYRMLLATAALAPGTTYSAPVVWEANALTSGTDTGTTTSNAAYFGAGYKSCSFATVGTAAVRLSGAVPVTPLPGRYSAYLRMGRSDTNSTFRVRLGQNFGLTQVQYGDYVDFNRTTSPAAGFMSYVPLGDFTWPLGADLRADVGGVSTPGISLEMSRLSGSGAAQVNGIVLIPVELAGSFEARQMFASFAGFGLDTGRSGTWDGDTKTFRAYELTGNLFSQGITPGTAGEFPSVVPGAVNVLHILKQTDPSSVFFTGSDNSDQITATSDVTLSYQPKWLFIGDGT